MRTRVRVAVAVACVAGAVGAVALAGSRAGAQEERGTPLVIRKVDRGNQRVLSMGGSTFATQFLTSGQEIDVNKIVVANGDTQGGDDLAGAFEILAGGTTLFFSMNVSGYGNTEMEFRVPLRLRQNDTLRFNATNETGTRTVTLIGSIPTETASALEVR